MDINYSRETPLWHLTVGQFADLTEKLFEDFHERWDAKHPSKEVMKELLKDPDRRYVKGVTGIANLFGCSNPTAQKLKKTIIKEAVTQNGRVIITDEEKAVELFRKYQEENGCLARIPTEK